MVTLKFGEILKVGGDNLASVFMWDVCINVQKAFLYRGRRNSHRSFRLNIHMESRIFFDLQEKGTSLSLLNILSN